MFPISPFAPPMQLKRKVVIDPLGLGCAQKRRRIYIIIVHRSIVVPSVKSHRDLESSLQNTIKKLKVVGSPPDPFLAKNLYIPALYVKVCQCLIGVCIAFPYCFFTYLEFTVPKATPDVSR